VGAGGTGGASEPGGESIGGPGGITYFTNAALNVNLLAGSGTGGRTVVAGESGAGVGGNGGSVGTIGIGGSGANLFVDNGENGTGYPIAGGGGGAGVLDSGPGTGGGSGLQPPQYDGTVAPGGASSIAPSLINDIFSTVGIGAGGSGSNGSFFIETGIPGGPGLILVSY